MYFVLAGGGKVGFFLARALIEGGHEVLVLEKLDRRYQVIAEDLGEAVMLGDACEVRTLERAGVDRADVVVAVTGDDEDNLVICQLAKNKFNVRRTIARINNPKNEDVFKQLGIDETVSATNVLLSLIEQELEAEEMLPLSRLRYENLEIVEIHLLAQSPSVGKSVRDIPVPSGCLLAVRLSDGKASVIHGDSVLQADDHIIAITPVESAAALRQILVGPALHIP